MTLIQPSNKGHYNTIQLQDTMNTIQRNFNTVFASFFSPEDTSGGVLETCNERVGAHHRSRGQSQME